MIRSRIHGTGRALPARILTNDELARTVDTSDEWIRERTGIRERRILDAGLAASDLAAEAARNACEAAGWDPATLDCIIVATVTPDSPLPSTAVRVQQKLGVGAGCAAFDLTAACAGFVYGLSIADSFIRTRQFKRVCVVGVEILSRIVDWRDRNTCVLFGDGAGAVALGQGDVARGRDDRGLHSTHIHADPTGIDHLHIPAGGSAKPASADTVAGGEHFVRMNGRQVYAGAVRNISAACEEALRANELTAADIDHVVAHQANVRILEGVAERCGLSLDKFYLNLERFGNTSSASVPIALDEAARAGRFKEGDRLLLCAMGAGFAYGSAYLRW
ncbi:MAG: ketoacyl-ACP synthase III [Deltaproteobacteria bacterium]|nr:ketoacyl-ACP synthase III [Deltaproteobacteria bacterium]